MTEDLQARYELLKGRFLRLKEEMTRVTRERREGLLRDDVSTLLTREDDMLMGIHEVLASLGEMLGERQPPPSELPLFYTATDKKA